MGDAAGGPPELKGQIAQAGGTGGYFSGPMGKELGAGGTADCQERDRYATFE